MRVFYPNEIGGASYLSNEEFDSIYNDSAEILKLLISITKTLKDNK